MDSWRTTSRESSTGSAPARSSSGALHREEPARFAADLVAFVEDVAGQRQLIVQSGPGPRRGP